MLRDVTNRVSGVLGALRDEIAPSPAPEPEPPQVAGGSEAVTAAEAEASSGETGSAPAVHDTPAPEVPLDEVCAAAVDLARAAAVEEAGTAVGEHLGVEPEPVVPGEAVATHLFATTDRAYTGWRWAVTVARAEGSEVVTVDEVVLLPGPEALLAPEWVPYAERVRPGDLSPGDVLPTAADDARLVPAAYAAPEDEPVDPLVEEVRWELGLGRPRVLSREGRADAAERWWTGDPGPDAPVARAAPGHCRDCGFLVPLSGSLRAAFGVCANEYAPDDGRVVALTHGCGAHSEVPVELTHVASSGMAVAREELEVSHSGADDVASDAEAESLGHS